MHRNFLLNRSGCIALAVAIVAMPIPALAQPPTPRIVTVIQDKTPPIGTWVDGDLPGHQLRLNFNAYRPSDSAEDFGRLDQNSGRRFFNELGFPSNYGYAGAITKLRPDDIIPMLGGIYRVYSITPGTSSRATFVSVSADKLPAEVVPAGDMLTPITLNGELRYSDFSLRLLSINADPKDGKAMTATFNVGSPDRNRKGISVSRDLVPLAVGDMIRVPSFNLTIKHIVPKNERLRIVGWVLLDPAFRTSKKPHEEEELPIFERMKKPD